jgi:hypothetical protein
MSSEENRRGDFDITDPKAMRALAHPVRMTLLELLRDNQTLTATQAAELLGETPANCAFHLRTLAKYGFVEEAGGGRGRERPWRTVAMRTMKLKPGQLDPQAAMAAQALGQLWRERVFDRVRQAFATSLPPRWAGARRYIGSFSYLTPEELEQVNAAIAEIMDRYSERDDPARRPEGTLPVELAFFSYPVAGQTRDTS